MDGHDGRGFRPIGSLTPQTVSSPSRTGSTPMTSGRNSSAFGGGTAVSKPTGRQPSATVSSSASAALAARIAGDSPEEIDRAIQAGLPPSLERCLFEKRRTWFDDYGYQSDFDGYVFTGEAPAGDIAHALSLVQAAMQPVPAAALRQHLNYLRAATGGRMAGDQTDSALVAAVLAEELRTWPHDVVRAAIYGWARREKWFPSLSELREELHRHGRRRAALLDALRNPRRPPAAQPPRPPEQTRAETDLVSISAES